ncbi:discoidin domain-containing protein [Paenibacillus terrigena]|uniref:discoidin domain-containing protein n=1 Tax=Paenibacillus terrigena TaxID=369333 RepID=UPI0028D17EF3|nr:discoidin domain-containing protein [Paenibacillus terrigena]
MFRKALSIMLAVSLCVGFLFVKSPSAQAAGNTYYVSTTGSDSNSGTQESPFRSIQKASSVMVAGDTCVIRSGTYHESIIPMNNGTATSPITYKAYSGEVVTISGSDPVTGWTKDTGSVYKASMNWNLGDENQIFVGGEMMRLAQYPNWTNDADVFNVGWASMQSGTSTSITDTALNKPDNYWVGATVIVKGWWSTQSAKITSSSGSTIKFDKLPWSDVYTNPGGGVKYMIAGIKGQLDRQKEWYYDSAASTLYLSAPGGVDPNTLDVEAKKRKYAFDLTGRSYITIEGVQLIGASMTTKDADHIMIKGIKAEYLSHTIGLQKAYSYDDTGIDLSGSYNTIRDSEIKYSSGNGVVIRGTNNNVINNLIHDTDYMGTYNASVALAGGKKHLVSYNTLYNTGRSIIGGEKFTESIIEYNDISRTGKLSYDLGGIYFARVDGANTEIRNNWIHDMDSQSCTSCELGVYVDSNTHGFLIHHNTVWNAETGLYIGGRADNNFIYNNQTKPKIIVNTGDYKYNNEVSSNIVEGGVSFQNGASSGVSAFTADNIATGYNQTQYGTAGHNFTNPPDPIFTHALPEYSNRALNYGFEADLDGWLLTGNKNVTYHFAPMLNLNDQFATTRTADGSALFGTGQNGIEQVVTGLQPNTRYEYSGWAKVASGEEAWLGVKDYGGADRHTVVTDTSNGWKHVMIQFTTGANATSVTMYMLKNSTGSGVVYGDDIGLRKVRSSELPDPNLIPQSQMTATATSEETVGENSSASKAIDGDPSTMWHTKWDKSDKLPQSITLNLGGTYNINKLTYLPRQVDKNGIFTAYNVYVSTDGTTFTKVLSGTWASDNALKTATFAAVPAKYIKLEATAAFNGWASAAEINVFKDPTPPAVEKQSVLAGPDKVNAGETFTVRAGFKGVTEQVYAEDLELTFDPNLMEVALVKALTDGVKIVDYKVTGNQLRIIAANVGAEHAMTGEVQVAEISFKAKPVEQDTAGTIAIAHAVLGDAEGKETDTGAATLTIQVLAQQIGTSGDLNGDSKVSIGDLAILAAHYGITAQSPDWNKVKAADFNHDGKIDISDLAALASKIIE